MVNDHSHMQRLKEFNKGVGNDVFNSGLDCEGWVFVVSIYWVGELREMHPWKMRKYTADSGGRADILLFEMDVKISIGCA